VSARVRALVCTARVAEDAGRFEVAADTWKLLAEPEQVLRCRVTHLERADDLPGAARLLESRERFEAAAACWERVGDARSVARCHALHEEKRGSMLKAAEQWEALGEPKRAVDCRAIHAFREGDYGDAARYYDAAGQPEMAVTSRVIAAQLQGDYEAAERAVVEAGHTDVKARLGDRETWLAEARQLAEARARDEAREARRQQRATRISGTATASRSDDGVSAGTGAPPARDPAELATAIVEALTRYPGLTCERLAEVVRSPTAPVKPHLAALIASGQLRKVGHGRGTRYHLV
jgi:tetratricopeptide (TPR) repeat protein